MYPSIPRASTFSETPSLNFSKRYLRRSDWKIEHTLELGLNLVGYKTKPPTYIARQGKRNMLLVSRFSSPRAPCSTAVRPRLTSASTVGEDATQVGSDGLTIENNRQLSTRDLFYSGFALWKDGLDYFLLLDW